MKLLLRAARDAARSLPLAAALVGLGSIPATAQDAPPPYVVNDVRLVDEPGAPRISLLLRNGRIAGIFDEPQARVPGARRIDGKGSLALPAFIDAYSYQGVQPPEPREVQVEAPSTESDVWIDMPRAHRKGIQAGFRAVDALDFGKEALEPWRQAGFGILHVTPRGQLLAGQSALVTARSGPPRDLVLRPSAFQSAAFQAVGRGYPSTLMGYHAQLRQFLHDASHHAARQQRWLAGQAGLRPPYDPDLEAAVGIARGSETLLCHAERKGDIARWLRLGEELALKPMLAGGREAHELVGLLSAAKVPVLLTLDWPKEVPDPDAKKKRAPKQEERVEGTPRPGDPPQDVSTEDLEAPPSETDPEVVTAAEVPAPGSARRTPAARPEAVWVYEEPLEVRRERRRLWEETRAGALRLHEGGVRLAFGTGSGRPGELLKRVRKLVELGLPKDAALHALTRGAAELLGIGERVGRIEVGYEAHLALWTASPFDEQARLAWIVIDGVPQRFEVEREDLTGAPDDEVDASGTWILVFEGGRAAEPTRLELRMDPDGSVEGTIRFFSPFAAEEVRGDVEGRVIDSTLRLDARLDISGFDVETTLTGELTGDSLTGEAIWRFSQGEQKAPFSATRAPRGGLR